LINRVKREEEFLRSDLLSSRGWVVGSIANYPPREPAVISQLFSSLPCQFSSEAELPKTEAKVKMKENPKGQTSSTNSGGN